MSEALKARIEAEGRRWHDLKIWPAYFDDVQTGHKPFEVRKNDRGFAQGDVLNLREWDPITERYTGRRLVRVIGYILTGPQFGIEAGHSVMALETTPGETAWQPIETAPKDGTHVLGWDGEHYVVIAWSTRDKEWFMPDDDGNALWEGITHWLPLPLFFATPTKPAETGRPKMTEAEARELLARCAEERGLLNMARRARGKAPTEPGDDAVVAVAIAAILRAANGEAQPPSSAGGE